MSEDSSTGFPFSFHDKLGREREFREGPLKTALGLVYGLEVWEVVSVPWHPSMTEKLQRYTGYRLKFITHRGKEAVYIRLPDDTPQRFRADRKRKNNDTAKRTVPSQGDDCRGGAR